MPALVQSAANSTHKAGSGRGSTSCRATFTNPTTAGSYVLVILVAGGGQATTPSLDAAGFTRLCYNGYDDTQLAVFGRANCPSLTSITGSVDAYRSLQIRAIEYSGIAQASAEDVNINRANDTYGVSTGTGTTTRADDLIVGVIANEYASTYQSSFSGGFTKVYESTSPDDDDDWERTRLTVHQLVPGSTGSYALGARLSSDDGWIAALIALKGGTFGPVRFHSTQQPALYRSGGNTGSKLTVFGRLFSAQQPALYAAGQGVRARIGPYDYQFRLQGWSGLTIGAGTDYRVESVDGLQGWEARTSDDDLPRGDGALRGPDLAAARQILFKINWTGTRQQIEDRMATLYRALSLQRDQDWELLYRLPGQPLKSVYVRPTNLVRSIDPDQVLAHKQGFTLRAADPRHYAASISNLTVPITTSRAAPNLVQALNLGNGLAYPIIRINGPSSGSIASRVTLTNTSGGGTFDVSAAIGAGSQLIGDMRSRVVGAPVSAVTVDGQSKYGAWQPPRVPFALLPGANLLMFEVQPADAVATCSIEWRSTWSG